MGVLVVDFFTHLIVADKRVPVTDSQFAHIFQPNLAPNADVPDAFKAAFCHVRPVLLPSLCQCSVLKCSWTFWTIVSTTTLRTIHICIVHNTTGIAPYAAHYHLCLFVLRTCCR